MLDSQCARSGRCQCGHIRYRINSDPLTLYTCHCLACQQQSSSAFGMSMWVAADGFELQTGELKFWSTKADDGSDKRCAFCPECGTRIYHVLGGPAEPISLKAGTLDGISQLVPVAHIWTKRAHRWLDLESGGALCYSGQPEHFNDILAAWSGQRV